jgi:hypothetical protein
LSGQYAGRSTENQQQGDGTKEGLHVGFFS